MNSAPLLLADIGGTNARFMRAPEHGALPRPVVYATHDFPSFEAALDAFLQSGEPNFAGVAIGAAGPIRNGAVTLTNLDWTISADRLRTRTGARRVHLVNDFEALAHGIESLEPQDLKPVGPALATPPPGVRLVIGPGTGLGIASIVPTDQGSVVAGGEGGHCDLAPGNAREDAIVQALRARFHHVSAERVLSGPGLELLYETLHALDGKVGPKKSAAAIADGQMADDYAREAIAIFTGLLGAVAGNFALALGAKGGVFLGGGILPRWGTAFDAALFRQRFEAKGRVSGFLAAIPVYLILAEDTAFRGLRRLALP